MHPTTVAVSHLSRSYERTSGLWRRRRQTTQALTDVSLTVQQGEIVTTKPCRLWVRKVDQGMR